MAAIAQIQDPFLQTILQTSTSVKQQTFALLELIESLQDSADGQSDESAPAHPELRKAQRALTSNLAVLRGQNRKLAHLVRDTKTTTGASRAEVDTLHLNLQNLKYEQSHLVGEISSCDEYPNIYKGLPLISEEEFLERFPEWQSKKDESSDENTGEQGLMRARIAQEKKEREELEARRSELVKRKMELVKENSKRKDELVKLDRDLEAFIEAAKPIQKTFEREYAPP